MISLLERSNNDCIFLSDTGCRIYPVRPLQCSSYPFWGSVLSSEEQWEDEAKECPGINNGKLHTKEEIEDWLDKRRAMKPKIVYASKYYE